VEKTPMSDFTRIKSESKPQVTVEIYDSEFRCDVRRAWTYT